MKGKLLIIEGSDGSGKATQVALLKKYLEDVGVPVKVISFPRYHDSFFGKFIARFLKGEFGKLEEINPYFISLVYAEDRKGAADEINQWLEEGYIVLADRYVTSNLAHQAGRLPPHARDEFIEWDMQLEYVVNGVPQEDLVILLHIPTEVSKQLILNRHKKDTLSKWKKDMVENNEAYLKQAKKMYDYLAKRFSHWSVIDCVGSKGELRSIDAIHTDIKKLLAKKRIVR